MALVNSDLFLVQDATTKTNYKVEFETIKDTVNGNINLDSRVAVVGDNMTGDLTLGPAGNVKIQLNASNGNATFAGDGDFTGNLSAAAAQITTSITGSSGLEIFGDSTSTNKVAIATNGDVVFDGNLSAAAAQITTSITGSSGLEIFGDSTSTNKVAIATNGDVVFDGKVGIDITPSYDLEVNDVCKLNGVEIGSRNRNQSISIGNGATNTSPVSATQCVAIGQQALQSNEGTHCVGIGAYTLQTGEDNDNTAVGSESGSTLQTGSKNVFIGREAGNEIANGSNNTFLGCYAGDPSSPDISDTVILSAGVTQRAICDNNGDWSFIGTIEAESIDGGTYA